ncbi:MAG: hypothetical protein JNL75_11465 [Chitinophagales bacterium]|nr:hypothetical protein [Chitinophagales bacterium]
MRRNYYLFLLVFFGVNLTAQDDIYNTPEPVKPRIVYGNQNSNTSTDGSYEKIDDSYNPDFDYRYRRSLRRMYDPYYVMPSSAFLNMYTYPQFANFYNPYWGWNSGFSITIGNAWGSPWGWNNGWNTWNNPWGWNSWNSWYAWNSPWGWNNWGGGWNSWNNPWCGWNSWGGGWNDPYWGGGWNNWGWNVRGNNWGTGQRNSVTPPERRVSRAVRVMDPNRDYGNTTYRPSQPQGNSGWNNGGSGNNTPTYRSSPSNSSPSQGTMTPAPTRMGGNSPSMGGGGSSGGGGRSGGRSSGASRF